MTLISGHGGILDWGDSRIAVKDWSIQCNKSTNGLKSWHGAMTISNKDFQAIMNEGKGVLVEEQINANFYKEDEMYQGQIRFMMTTPRINFKGTGSLQKSQRWAELRETGGK